MKKRPILGLEVTRSQLSRSWPSLLGWSLALASLSVMYTAFWPAFDGATLQALTDDLPPALVEALGYQQVGTPEGWLTSTIYGILGPLLLLAFAIGFGAKSMAGDEHEGICAVELSQPVSRIDVALGRLFAGLVQLVVLIGVLTLATRVTSWIVSMDVATWQFVEGADALFTFAVPWLAISWAVSAATGRRDLAVGITTILAVLAYVLHVLGPTTGYKMLSRVSPFHWYLESDLLIDGANSVLLVFGIVTTVTVATIGTIAFSRRDIGS